MVLSLGETPSGKACSGGIHDLSGKQLRRDLLCSQCGLHCTYTRAEDAIAVLLATILALRAPRVQRIGTPVRRPATARNAARRLPAAPVPGGFLLLLKVLSLGETPSREPCSGGVHNLSGKQLRRDLRCRTPAADDVWISLPVGLGRQAYLQVALIGPAVVTIVRESPAIAVSFGTHFRAPPPLVYALLNIHFPLGFRCTAVLVVVPRVAVIMAHVIVTDPNLRSKLQRVLLGRRQVDVLAARLLEAAVQRLLDALGVVNALDLRVVADARPAAAIHVRARHRVRRAQGTAQRIAAELWHVCVLAACLLEAAVQRLLDALGVVNALDLRVVADARPAAALHVRARHRVRRAQGTAQRIAWAL